MTTYPTGTITFLFTDIEGSTRLWEAYPDAMRPAVARHDALLRQAVGDNGGYLFKTTGDGVAAAFALAPDALAAALSAQNALAAEAWPADAVLRSRMGLHTGAAEWRDGDYFGSTLNRCARLMAAGHGGQTLLSDVTHELTRDSLPAEVSLLPLGEQRLKDLSRPETIYQLAHPALVATFPPLRTLDETPNNLPQQVTSFVGREKPLAEVAALLAKTRLLTLTGSGGSGKTRLSLQAAADALDGYPDGAWLVELASLSDSGLVPQTVAAALGVREQAGQTIMQTLTDFLKPKRLLLVLDNCEHLLGACASLVAALMRACPQMKVIATSREPLGIGGETTYRVPTLSLPSASQAKAATPESLSQFEAVRLFIERAMAVKPDFATTNANAPALAQLCYRLDGIPLALELAAARVRSLSVEQINDKLDSRFRLLTGGDRSALPRQQTLRALIDWSYDLLTENEKMLLARLSVFAGGWTLEAAESVGGVAPIEEWETLDLLTSLADKSLILSEETAGEQATRYRMLETVRQYATEKREMSGETIDLSARQIAFFVALAEEAEPQLRGPEQVRWLNRLEAEHDNLRVVLDVCAILTRQAPQTSESFAAEAALSGMRLAGALWQFWGVRGCLTEGGAHLMEALAGRQVVSQAAERRVVDTLTAKQAVAGTLLAAGMLLSAQGDDLAAQPLLEESRAIYSEIGYKRGVGIALNCLGNIAFSRGEYEVARSAYEESLALGHELGDRQGICVMLNCLGDVAAIQDDYAKACLLYEESITLCRANNDKIILPMALMNLGFVAAAQGDIVAARSLYKESLVLNREVGNRQGIAQGLRNIAVTCFLGEDNARQGAAILRGATLWAASSALRESIGASLPPLAKAEMDAAVAQARAALGDEAAWTAACVDGGAMPWEQAVELALAPAAHA